MKDLFGNTIFSSERRKDLLGYYCAMMNDRRNEEGNKE